MCYTGIIGSEGNREIFQTLAGRRLRQKKSASAEQAGALLIPFDIH